MLTLLANVSASMGYLAFVQRQNGCDGLSPRARQRLMTYLFLVSTSYPLRLTISVRLLNSMPDHRGPKKDVSAEEALPLLASSSSSCMREDAMIN